MNVLLLGGTGAMGCHLHRWLVDQGVKVTITSRKAHAPELNTVYEQGDAHDKLFLQEVLRHQFDAVVDFMTWEEEEFKNVVPLLISSCGQYVFLSSYRVFAASDIIVEDSPRLVDVCPDRLYCASDEYAVRKAREEDWLRAQNSGNWTIVRPSITYSASGRFQLGAYEASQWLWRALNGLPIPFSRAMASCECTMTWGGDAARMIGMLLGRDGCLGQVYNVVTSKHQSWQDIIDAYSKVLDLDIRWIDVHRQEVFDRGTLNRYGYVPQVRYDRMVNRVMDNSKILEVTGLDESELEDATKRIPIELTIFLSSNTPDPSRALRVQPTVQGRLDDMCGMLLSPMRAFELFEGKTSSAKYYAGRFGLR